MDRARLLRRPQTPASAPGMDRSRLMNRCSTSARTSLFLRGIQRGTWCASLENVKSSVKLYFPSYPTSGRQKGNLCPSRIASALSPEAAAHLGRLSRGTTGVPGHSLAFAGVVGVVHDPSLTAGEALEASRYDIYKYITANLFHSCCERS